MTDNVTKIEAYLGLSDRARAEAGDNAAFDNVQARAAAWRRLLGERGAWRDRFAPEQRAAILDYWRERIKAPVKDEAKGELHPTYVTDAKLREQVELFWRCVDHDIDRDDAYRRATGNDVKHLSDRFKEACAAFGRPWPAKPRGGRR